MRGWRTRGGGAGSSLLPCSPRCHNPCRALAPTAHPTHTHAPVQRLCHGYEVDRPRRKVFRQELCCCLQVAHVWHLRRRERRMRGEGGSPRVISRGGWDRHTAAAAWRVRRRQLLPALALFQLEQRRAPESTQAHLYRIIQLVLARVHPDDLAVAVQWQYSDGQAEQWHAMVGRQLGGCGAAVAAHPGHAHAKGVRAQPPRHASCRHQPAFGRSAPCCSPSRPAHVAHTATLVPRLQQRPCCPAAHTWAYVRASSTVTFPGPQPISSASSWLLVPGILPIAMPANS